MHWPRVPIVAVFGTVAADAHQSMRAPSELTQVAYLVLMAAVFAA